MEPLTERYTRYLEAKEGDIELCEYFTFDEYMLYEAGYKDLEKGGSKALKYGAAGLAGTAVGATVLGPLGPLVGLMFMAILKKYRFVTDKCINRCKGLAATRKAVGPEFALCRAKCNLGAAEGMLAEVESKRKTVLQKAKNEKQQASINKKFDKKGEFFRKKIADAKQMIQDYEGSMRGRK